MRTAGDVVARQATLAEIFDVRWTVLRPGRPIETAKFPGDDEAGTIHVGAFVGDRNVCCATGTRTTWADAPAWQLRGMGVSADWQKRGVGQLVLAELEALMRATWDVPIVWCNAREEAVAFYEKQGWRVASEAFHIADVGPHYKMTKAL